ncbi:helix-turn-helix domain-containing protein [Fimbriiglobus ruber]|uniref:Putative transcriptional regulator n=1 Tax=Fimbriiglobus ruber TaxID=1908690 RepID=A0A225D4X3_9BACT|nr:helix-turn-helix transcriptional regulator [Fimbriiglobus ruber]OWK36542.1 putative transcriptional regulator [Fimbriiglobus ruber]
MNAETRKALEAKGYVIYDQAEDWLGLTDEERQLVDLRLRTSRAVAAARERAGLTQKELAAKMKSSQSRVAKIESGANDVSLDLAFKALFASGGKIEELVEVGGRKPIVARKPKKTSKPGRKATA